jgi:hypothetical protein
MAKGLKFGTVFKAGVMVEHLEVCRKLEGRCR